MHWPRVGFDVTALKQGQPMGIANKSGGHPGGNPAPGIPRARVDSTDPGYLDRAHGVGYPRLIINLQQGRFRERTLQNPH